MKRQMVLLLMSVLVLAALAQSAKTPPKRTAKPAIIDPGSVTNGVYTNRGFGFSYKIPFGWVERTDEMQEGSEPGKSATLLSIFERPPDAVGETVNSAV